jgi:hypothetical protein
MQSATDSNSVAQAVAQGAVMEVTICGIEGKENKG